MGVPGNFSIEFDRCFLMFPYWIAHGRPRPLSYRFWKETLEVSIWELTRGTPDQFPIDGASYPSHYPIDFERISLRLPSGSWWGGAPDNFLIDFRWKLLSMPKGKVRMSSPDHIHIEFARNSSVCFHVGIVQGGTSGQFPTYFERVPLKASQTNFL